MNATDDNPYESPLGPRRGQIVSQEVEERLSWDYMFGDGSGWIGKPAFPAIQADDADAVAHAISKNPKTLFEKDLSGRTPLHYATELGRSEIIDLLLFEISKNDNVRALDSLDLLSCSPIYYACSHRRIEPLLAMLKIRDDAENSMKTTKLWSGCSPLYPALANDDDEIVDILMASSQKRGTTKQIAKALPFHHAAVIGSVKSVKPLSERLPKGAIDMRDLNGLSPIALAIKNDSLKMTAALLEHGADPNAKIFVKQTLVSALISLFTGAGADIGPPVSLQPIAIGKKGDLSQRLKTRLKIILNPFGLAGILPISYAACFNHGWPHVAKLVDSGAKLEALNPESSDSSVRNGVEAVLLKNELSRKAPKNSETARKKNKI